MCGSLRVGGRAPLASPTAPSPGPTTAHDDPNDPPVAARVPPARLDPRPSVSAPNPRFGRRGLVAALIGVALVMSVSIVGIFFVLVERQRAMQRNERASAVWATYQFEKESKKLRAAVDAWLLDRDKPSLKEVGLRFDVLYSSVIVLENANLPKRFDSEPQIAGLLASAKASVQAMTPIFDQLLQDPDPGATLLRLRAMVIELDIVTENMLGAAYIADSQLKDRDAHATNSLYTMLAMVVAGMAVSLLAVMGIIVRQMRRNEDDWARLDASEREVTQKTLQLREQEQREAILRREAELKGASDTMNAQLERHVSRLTAMISDITAMCEAMNAATNTARENSRAAATSTARAADHVAGVAGEAEEMSLSGRDIANKTTQSALRYQDVKARTARTDTAVKELERATDEIDHIARLIEQVAGHTNLLALNATIEAARAGEAGRGFAVVASEIKSLAAQTKEATSEIARQIQATKIASAYCIETLDEIRNDMVEMTSISDDVSGIVEGQSASATEVARMIRAAAEEATSASNLGRTVMTAAEAANASAETALRLVREMNAESQKIRSALRG